MPDVFGIPVSVVHGLVVELHTGVAVFAFLALIAMLATDVLFKRWLPADKVRMVRRDADTIAYFGAISATVFLVLSGITGYLIEPYATDASSLLILNKELAALGALYFWGAYALIRFWSGPRLWERRGLYALEFVTSILAIFFTAIAGSIGAELSAYGMSVMTPLYDALGVNFTTFTITQMDVYLTADVLAIAALLIFAIVHLSELPRRSPERAGP